jgi:hypothetical protein
MSDSESVQEAAAELAGDLAASDRVVVSRPVAHRTLRDELELSRVGHDALRAGFGAEGWTYDRHLYFRPDALAERAAELSGAYRGAGRLLVSHGELLADLVEPETEIDDVNGWREGAFVGALGEALAGEGWRIDTVGEGAASQRLYLYPLFAALNEEHPRGRYPLDREELFAYYLGESIEAALTN